MGFLRPISSIENSPLSRGMPSSPHSFRECPHTFARAFPPRPPNEGSSRIRLEIPLLTVPIGSSREASSPPGDVEGGPILLEFNRRGSFTERRKAVCFRAGSYETGGCRVRVSIQGVRAFLALSLACSGFCPERRGDRTSKTGSKKLLFGKQEPISGGTSTGKCNLKISFLIERAPSRTIL